MRKRKTTSTAFRSSKCPKKEHAGPTQVVEFRYCLYRVGAFSLIPCHPKIGSNLVLWVVFWNRSILVHIFVWEINIVVRHCKWYQYPPLRHGTCLYWCPNTCDYISVLCCTHNRHLSPVFSKFLTTLSMRLWCVSEWSWYCCVCACHCHVCVRINGACDMFLWTWINLYAWTN